MPEDFRWPSSFEVSVSSSNSLADAFGGRGLSLSHFESRTTRHRANGGLEEELYLLRRYLFTLARHGLLKYPFTIRKQESPDFVCANGAQIFGIEITEATSPSDQREMTLAEPEEASLIGAYGGRYADGAIGELPERDLVADVIRAIRRKATKIRAGKGYNRVQSVRLLIYANSNSSFLADEHDALDLITSKLERWKSLLTARTHIDQISLIVGDRLAIYPPALVGVMPLQAQIISDGGTRGWPSGPS